MKKILGVLLLVSSLVQAKEDKVLLLPVFSLGEVKKPKATLEMTEAIEEALKNNGLPVIMGNTKSETVKKIQKTVMANQYTSDLQTQVLQAAKQQQARYVLVLAMTYNAPLYRVGGYLADAEHSLFTALNEISPDVEMLSVSIEAHALIKNVQYKQQNFDPLALRSNQEFLPNVVVAVVKPITTPVTQPVATQNLIAPVKKEPPMVASLQNAKPVYSTVTSENSLPIKAAPVSKTSEASPVTQSVATKEQIAPLKKESPIVASLQNTKPVYSTAIPLQNSVPIKAAPISQTSKMLGYAEPIASVSATENKNNSVFKKWWFWTAVGVGAGLLGVGTWAIVDHTQQNNNATVSATWR